MKAKTLCAAALATLFLGGTAVSAAPMDPMNTNGKVTVENGTIPKEGTDLVDPEDPTKVVPELPGVIVNPNEDRGALEISHAPALDFGTVKTGTTEQKRFASNNTWVDGDGVTQTRGALLQFGDVRTDANGYSVSAKMTQQFTQGANVLTGSTIDFKNPYSNTAAGSTGTSPDFGTGFKLAFNESETVATAANADKSGKGLWAVEYGSSQNVVAEDTTAASVELAIPGNTASSMTGGAYVAVIQWAISTTP